MFFFRNMSFDERCETIIGFLSKNSSNNFRLWWWNTSGNTYARCIFGILKYDDANGGNLNMNMAFTVDNVDTELFVGAVEETDESLNGKVAARAEKIEVDKDIDIDERRG